jgi:protein-L-isoaspartate(D-aspartate) O-methyltransferase
MTRPEELRRRMVTRHVLARGVKDKLVLDALQKVPREKFLPPDLAEYAYSDQPLPIGQGQTISQPYIVAVMIEALKLKGGEKVLEIGVGSGYAAAVLGEIASEVHAIERVGQLAEKAAIALMDTGYNNVHVKHADGTEGLEEEAPFDAILVSAGAPEVPPDLKAQLKIGGRLVIPVGTSRFSQELLRITRRGETSFDEEDLADVRFVPLIGKAGWEDEVDSSAARLIRARHDEGRDVTSLIVGRAQEVSLDGDVDLTPLLRRVGDARVVLLGEATHGTAEFYEMRAVITRALIEDKGFQIVAVEADWPDAAQIDRRVRRWTQAAEGWPPFTRFPTWMWRNEEFRDFTQWLRRHNENLPERARVSFHGLDLYSLNASIRSVIEYLENTDPLLAEVARERYGCLSPWETDPAVYGRVAISGAYRACEDDVTRMLVELLRQRQDGVDDEFFDAVQNARLITAAERYYRIMYYGSRASWNLRDSHMAETLGHVLNARGPHSKAVVWAHNSHVGDASATEMAQRGEHNLGQLCRKAFGDACYLIGFGTDHGTVAAAPNWDAPMQVMQVRSAHPQSCEHLCHQAGMDAFILPLNGDGAAKEALAAPRLERAIGVVYRPDTELASHYFEARLAEQFDDYVWIDETRAVTPLATREHAGAAETYPFGL